MLIKVDNPGNPELMELLADHIRDMRSISPPESTHTLEIGELQRPEITLWSGSLNSEIVGCAAIKELSSTHGEIKSMRTSPTHRGRGVARRLLNHILAEARTRRYHRLSLETGSMDFFRPAQQLYTSAGFEYCEPFGDYQPDPNSLFMTKEL
ncbi:MAG: GNAT family N-acetyltransferase [Planctomycetota bacterium]